MGNYFPTAMHTAGRSGAAPKGRRELKTRPKGGRLKPRLALHDSSHHLDKTEEFLSSKGLSDRVPIGMIRKLAEKRHDLMHGMAFTVLWPEKKRGLSYGTPAKQA